MQRARSFSWLVLGNVTLAASQWGILVLLARLGSAEMVGTFGIANALVTPVFMFAKMRLGDVMATTPQGESIRPYATLAAAMAMGAVGVAVALSAGIGYGAGTLLIITLIAVAKMGEALSDFAQGGLLRARAVAAVGRSAMRRGVLPLLGVAAGLGLGRTLATGMVGYLCGYLVSMLLDGAVLRREASTGFAAGDRTSVSVRRVLALSLPLAFVASLSAIASNVPRYGLEAFAGREAVGIYTTIFTSLAAINVLNDALVKSNVAELTEAYHADVRHFLRRLTRLALMSLGIAAFALLVSVGAGEVLLRLVFGAPFDAYADVLVISTVAVTAGLLNAHVKKVLLIMRRMHVQLGIILVSLAAGAVVAWSLIPAYGVVGGAWSIVAVMWGEFLAGLFVVLFTLKSVRHRAAVFA